jgi:16S rRNA (uracil1498-N3)-methyltransferase
MYRIFIQSRAINDGRITFADKDDVHYLNTVVRMKVGEAVEAVDEKGVVYRAQIEAVGKDKVSAVIKESKSPEDNANNYALTVACAIPKKAKFDEIIDKLTQLGVTRIIPLRTERVVVKIKKLDEDGRVARWRKIVESASLQSKRGFVPMVEQVSDFAQVIAQAKEYEVKIIPALVDARVTLKEALGDAKGKRIIVLIGPEGDFTPQEVMQAKAAGFVPVTLGERVLRVDTAAIAVAGFISLNE